MKGDDGNRKKLSNPPSYSLILIDLEIKLIPLLHGTSWNFLKDHSSAAEPR